MNDFFIKPTFTKKYYMKCTTIKEALKHYNEVTDLYLTGDECKEAYTNEVEKFTNLKSLHFLPQLKEWSSFPKGFKKLNIDILHVSGIRINELIGLKVRELGVSIANIDIVPLCKNFPSIEELSLSLGRNAEFSIPKEIEKLSKLKKLSIRWGTLTKVAEEIANLKNLKTLNLNKLKFNDLPIEFTSIPNIEEFSLISFPKLITLPEEIENWQKLETLTFKDCFKNREEMSFDDELFHEDKPTSLPSAIAKLKNLKKFEILFCPVKNLDSLAALTNLEEIKITQTKLKDIDFLKKLVNLKKLDLNGSYDINTIDSLSDLINLEHLNISNSKIEDLQALSKLTKLEYLNIKGCFFDKSKTKLQNALLPLYTFKNLKTIKASHITQEEWDRRDVNETLKNKISPEEIITILGNNNPALVEEALNAIDDIETVFDVSKYDADDNTLKIDVLDTAVSANISELSDKTLQNLIAVSFADTGMGDSYEVTILVTKEIIKRKSLAGQHHIVKAFINCTEYYDSGHRYYGSTVQDQLIDDLFPEFELVPLAELILSLDDGILNPEYGDNMCSLYPHVFSKIENNNVYESRILEHLSNYIFENIEDEIVQEILNEILEKDISENVKKAVLNLKETTTITSNALKNESIADFETLLQKINISVPLAKFANFDLEDVFKTLSIKDLSYDLLFKTFLLTIPLENTSANHQINKVLFTLNSEKLEQYLKSIPQEDEKLKEHLILILNKNVTNIEEKYINKEAYKEFTQKNKYRLQGKNEEDIKRGLAEKKAIELKNEIIATQKKELKTAFNQSIHSVNNDFFIHKSQEIIESELLADYSFEMANYTTKTIINSLQNGDFVSAKKIVLHFTEKLLPIVGTSRKQDDVASNSLVLAIMAKDKEVEVLVFEKLLPKNFEAKDIINEILAFNLSCYYAFNNNKKSMLAMIAQSLNLGKSPQEFKNDTDFSAYWEDEDFIAILNA